LPALVEWDDKYAAMGRSATNLLGKNLDNDACFPPKPESTYANADLLWRAAVMTAHHYLFPSDTSSTKRSVRVAKAKS